MDLGLVLQTTPPSARVVDLAKRAEAYGFSHVWTFDSHLLWQEPYVIYSRILAETRNIVVGPMVTNPATRDWTVTASVFATLNEMYGNRTVCGIGRGDSAVRVTNGKPTSIDTLRQSGARHPRAGQRPGSRVQGLDAAPSRGRRQAGSDVWIAGYGPRALALAGEVGDGFILQLADPDITAWTIKAVREAAEQAGRDPGAVTICVAAPAYVSDDVGPRPQTSAAGSAGWSATTSPTSSPVTATRRRCRPPSPTTSRDEPATTTTSTARPAMCTPSSCPTRSSTASASSAPSPSHVRRLDELRQLGVDQFAVYLQHDAKDATLQAYGEQVIPALAEHVRAKT